MRDQNTNPFQLVIQSLSQSPHQSIQQFTVKKRYHALLRFCSPPPQFPTGYLFSVIRSPIALSFFIQGVGVPLLLDVIRIVKPTHIVQFNYATKENVNKNLPKMTAELFASTPGWAFTVEEEERPENNSRLLKQISVALCLTFIDGKSALSARSLIFFDAFSFHENGCFRKLIRVDMLIVLFGFNLYRDANLCPENITGGDHDPTVIEINSYESKSWPSSV